MDDQPCVMGHEEREPALDGLLVCKRHRRRMDDDVTEIGLLVIDSQRIFDGGAPQDAGPSGGKVKKRADPPAPGDTTLMALYDQRSTTIEPARSYLRNWNANSGRLESNGGGELPAVLAIVASWVLLVADERPLTAVLPRSVLAQLDLLRRHHEWMAAQPFVDDYLLELAELRKALAMAVRDVQFERRGVCRLPVDGQDDPCGGVLLEENGTRAVRCVRCKARWVTDQELARLAVSLESA